MILDKHLFDGPLPWHSDILPSTLSRHTCGIMIKSIENPCVGRGGGKENMVMIHWSRWPFQFFSMSLDKVARVVFLHALSFFFRKIRWRLFLWPYYNFCVSKKQIKKYNIIYFDEIIRYTFICTEYIAYVFKHTIFVCQQVMAVSSGLVCYLSTRLFVRLYTSLSVHVWCSFCEWMCLVWLTSVPGPPCVITGWFKPSTNQPTSYRTKAGMGVRETGNRAKLLGEILHNYFGNGKKIA